MLSRLIALVAPPTCLACSEPCRAGARLCPGCRRAIPRLDRACCPRCALPAPCGVGASARGCPAVGAAFDAAWAATAYDGPARSLVHALKFRAALAAADVMAAQLVAAAPERMLGGVLVPVPPDRVRRRRRGYDHADALARAVATRAGLPVQRALERPAGLHRQVGAGRAARDRRRRTPIRVREPVSGYAVLIDDVMTTGATADACADALRRAGAERIAVVAYARTLP